MSCLFRLSTPLESNFKALFSSRNRLRALNYVIVLLAGRCDVGHKNVNRTHAHGSACTQVAATQDMALGNGYTGATTDTTQQSGQTADKEAGMNDVTVLCQRLHGNQAAWHVVSQQNSYASSRESGHTLAAVCIGFEYWCNGQTRRILYSACWGPKREKLP